MVAVSLSAAVFLFSFCINDHQAGGANINGEWHWFETFNPWIGPTYADSVGYSLSLNISTRTREALQFRDGVPTNKYRLQFEYSDWISAEAWHLYPEEENGGIISVIEIRSSDEMVVYNTCYDCSIHYYRR